MRSEADGFGGSHDARATDGISAAVFRARERFFPEELPGFLLRPRAAINASMEAHEDHFSDEFWRAIQQRFRTGEIPRVFPYPAERRLV